MSYIAQDASSYIQQREGIALRDSRLVSAVLAGSSDAFAELQRLYSGKLYLTIVGITKNREDAEDAVQETFLRAYLALPGFQGRSSFSSWLNRIAINSALMILRKRRTHPEVQFEPPQTAEEDIHQIEIRDDAPDPEQIYDQRQRCVNIYRAIQRLNSKLRGPIQARMMHGSSLKEIAQALGTSEAAIKARLHRARGRLSPVIPPSLRLQ